MRIGAECELYFLNAFKDPCKKPYWLVSVTQAPPRLDALGVDAIAQVRYPGSGDLVDVPIQIKSNKKIVAEYYLAHPEARRAHVVVLVIWMKDDPRLIRERLCERIQALRCANIRFEEYFRSLEQCPLSGVMRARINKIASERVEIEAALA